MTTMAQNEKQLLDQAPHFSIRATAAMQERDAAAEAPCLARPVEIGANRPTD
jgi:hypothetical protein